MWIFCANGQTNEIGYLTIALKLHTFLSWHTMCVCPFILAENCVCGSNLCESCTKKNNDQTIKTKSL